MSGGPFPSERTNPDESSDDFQPSSATAGKGGSELNLRSTCPFASVSTVHLDEWAR